MTFSPLRLELPSLVSFGKFLDGVGGGGETF